MNAHDNRGVDLFLKHEQALGLSHCLLLLCKDVNHPVIQDIKLALDKVIASLEQATDVAKEFGEEKAIPSTSEQFKAYKLFYEAKEDLHDGIDLINPASLNGNKLYLHIVNAAWAIFDLLHSATELANDLLENPPAKQAA
ncbi:hypothetical protein EXU30_04030 [Shewanella maritima]|uniref:Uncharacterized protein n=1 Tax=Shewanella maritima TaxID=2520507 RepID=A0A411PEG9_9GAMM|nr:hypothetical protein [Shewanella maritima]QBF81959.1 hypothetical protein EXU30_04030 [Shewanella maritima]